jgi:hypothetical protein
MGKNGADQPSSWTVAGATNFGGDVEGKKRFDRKLFNHMNLLVLSV